MTPTQGEHAQTEALRPKFGDLLRNTMASESNPRRDAYFIREVHRSGGGVNPGRWFEMTDGKGETWLSNPQNMVSAATAQPAAPQGVAEVNWWEANGDKYDASISPMQPAQGVAYAELPTSYTGSVLSSGRPDAGYAAKVTFTFNSVADAEAWHEAIIEPCGRASNGQAPAGAADEMAINRPVEDSALPFNRWRGEMQSALKRAGVYAARSPGAGNKLTLRWRATRDDVLPAPTAQAASSAVLKAIREANMQLVRTGDDAFMLVPYKAVTAQAAASVPAVDEFQPCPSCFGKGVDGDTDDYGRTIDVTCGECEGSGRAKVKGATEPKNAPSRYRDKCTLGGRCLGGCLVTEPCYHAARAPAESVGLDAPAAGAVAGPVETIKFSDGSTADPVEKARRYLNAMADHRINSQYFFDDGWPKKESAIDAMATLAVLEQLAAAPTPAAQADSVLEDAARWQALPAFYEEYQIDAMKLYRDIDAYLDAARKQGGAT